jgi:hypothetical protein
MKLANVSRGVKVAPLRVILYGIAGVGKTTWAAGAPDPIFLCAEEGSNHLDVARFPVPQSWADVIDAIDTLTNEKHDHKTLVIDSLDWLEPMNWAHTCALAGEKWIEGKEKGSDFGFGKGYNAALDTWRVLLSRLDNLRDKRGMHVVALAHAIIAPFRNPDESVGDYDRYTLKLQDSKKTSASGLWKEWAEDLFFAQFEVFGKKSEGRTRGVSTGNRIMHTTHSAAWDAKNRHSLPAELPLSWTAFSEAAKGKTAEAAEKEQGS